MESSIPGGDKRTHPKTQVESSRHNGMHVAMCTLEYSVPFK